MAKKCPTLRHRLLGGSLIGLVAAVIVLTAYALWPSWRHYNVRRAIAQSTQPPFWWPKTWHNEHDALQELIKAVESKRGVTEFRASWFFQPTLRTRGGRALDNAIQGVKQTAGSELGIELLTNILRDETQAPSVRLLAAYCLGEFGIDAVAAVPALIAILSDTPNPIPDSHTRVISEEEAAMLFQAGRLRAYAAISLGKIGPAAKPAIPALTDAANEDPPWYQLTQSCAVGALRLVNPTPEGTHPR